MPLFQLILVALIQGITEFLPVSSSGHLILLPGLTGLADQGQLIDVAVHVGTLGAVVLFFWRDVTLAVSGLPGAVRGKTDTPGAKLALGLLLATIPVIVAGALLHFTGMSEHLRSVAVIGWTMLIFGIVLYWADQKGRQEKTARDWGPADAIKLGLWQAVSLIPGTSRSGITITGARSMGYTREDAARIAMLMSIPKILASGILLGTNVAVQADSALMRDAAIAAGMAFIAALFALAFMMRLLRSVSFTPYVIYRIILGVILLAYAYA
ncbi:MAG: undecaprenyl-diphosphate phosphatase [Arenibacterium sp.]